MIKFHVITIAWGNVPVLLLHPSIEFLLVIYITDNTIIPGICKHVVSYFTQIWLVGYIYLTTEYLM